MRKALFLLMISLFMAGCSDAEEAPEFLPLSKHGDFYIAVDSENRAHYVDYEDGTLYIIGPGRTAIDKYECEVPKLFATIFEATQIIEAGRRQTSDTGGIAIGNLYITNNEIIAFNFADLSILDRQPLKKTGVIRIGNYDDYVEKLDLLWNSVNDKSEYRVTIDIKENPVLFREDRIVYFEDGYVYLKNVSGLFEEPISYADFYDSFVQVQGKSELLRRSNDLYDYLCLVFRDDICFISDTGHLLFSKGE